MVRIGILRCTFRQVRQGASDILKVPLIGGQHHVLGRLGKPAVDEIAMKAVCIPARQLERRLTGPAVGENAGRIEADREPQLGDALHLIGAAVRVRQPRAAGISALQGCWVDTIGETKLRLQTAQVASCVRPAVGVGRCLWAILAPPAHVPQVTHLVRRRRAGITGHRFEIGGNGNLRGVNVLVIGLEVSGLDRDEGGAVVGVEGRVPYAQLDEYILANDECWG